MPNKQSDLKSELEQAQILGMDVMSYPLKDKDILLVKQPEQLDDDQFAERLENLVNYLNYFSDHPIQVFGVTELDDLMVLSVDDMNSIGWYHKDQIMMLKKDMPEFNKADEEE